MECTYTPPSGHSVQKAFWTKELVTSGSEPPDLLDDPEYRDRVQYLGDKHSGCTLRFKNLTEKDQSKYYFTFTTDQPGGKYQGEGGVDLSVTDLQVEVPERVIEGDKVTLTCKTTCSLTVTPTFTWYRNGHRLSSSTDQLHLQPENHYGNLGTDPTPDPDPSNEDDVQYASVVPRKVRNPRNAEGSAVTASAFGADEEVQYASIQHRCNKVVETTEEDDVQYASVRFTRTGAANRPAVSTYDDVSVIYSTLK
ncbi:hypothetical protein MHYP_G00100080 [Metynnis hypsauchen]